MKVFFVTSELYPWVTGGPQNVVYHLAGHLAGEVDLSMLCIAPEDGVGPQGRYGKDIAFNLIPDRGWGAFKYLYRNLAYINRVKTAGEPDIVHFHILPGANCCLLPSYLRRKSRARLVLTLYDWIPDELEYYGTTEKLQHIMHWSMARRRLRYFDHFIVNSSYMKGIVSSYGLDNVEIMPNGIDASEWKVEARKHLKGALNVLFWGKLYDKKGVEELIRSFAASARERKDSHLYIGGDGPEGARYRELARSLGMADRITFTGPLLDDELKLYLNSSDLCVFPSAYEGFGISILEAMAAGKPVITSARGGQTDFAREGHNARLVDMGEPGGLSRAISELLDDAALRNRLAAAAAATAREYGWRRIALDYTAMYERLLGEAR